MNVNPRHLSGLTTIQSDDNKGYHSDRPFITELLSATGPEAWAKLWKVLRPSNGTPPSRTSEMPATESEKIGILSNAERLRAKKRCHRRASRRNGESMIADSTGDSQRGRPRDISPAVEDEGRCLSKLSRSTCQSGAAVQKGSKRQLRVGASLKPSWTFLANL
ncbi:hypothetical protein BU26DRAFT_132502 [Trematosphaeria pertusa]|uniref:Uncharacterized protein n=1 Tax=Trematosphaeria pertusa TaxID=390896 RepID=A0A6A6HYS0_9PLEO|nr:uncharacterized protein BU26DRAFT_132502 [Trematosphaeria pertusa]KAF2242763.1 hypothetical protein BU26DRAFT_132502 [Trematosphaeria pertusa]